MAKKNPVEKSPKAKVETAAPAIDEAQARVDGWVKAKNVEAVLAMAEDEAAPGPARKAARRGLQILKARGVAIPDKTHVARIVGETAIVEAWMISPDASGASLLLIGSHTPTSRYQIAEVMVQAGTGVLQIQRMEMSGSQIRAWFDDLVKRFGHGPTSVPLDWARARIAAARADHKTSGTIPPLGLDAHADLIGPAPDKTPEHPIDTAKIEPSGKTGIETSGALHNEPELRGWVPTGPAVQELIAEIGLGLSKQGPPEAQPEKDVFDKIMAEAIDTLSDRFFTPEVRAGVAAALKDAAISVLARVGRERAADLLSVAKAVTEAGLITNPPHEVPFLRAFFQKAIAILAAQAGGQISIPVPRQAVEPAPGEKMSPGGIVLP